MDPTDEGAGDSVGLTLPCRKTVTTIPAQSLRRAIESILPLGQRQLLADWSQRDNIQQSGLLMCVKVYNALFSVPDNRLWLDIARQLEDSNTVKIRYWIGATSFFDQIHTRFPTCIVHDSWDAMKGRPAPKLASESVAPLDPNPVPNRS